MKLNPFASNKKLVWQVWQQWKVFHERPSKTYGVKDELAAFLFDRGVYMWGTFVESKMDEAENNTRKSMRNRKGTDTFVASVRQRTFNSLMGIKDTTGVYKQPEVIKRSEDAKQITAEGNFDLKGFNG